jgi:cytoskeleton protein RodZ
MSDTAFNEPGSGESAAPYQALVEQSVRPTPPGAQLAARREQLKLTVEHVANQLNLAPRQIQALEADNYGALPGMASVRGFIRAYAKLLKMDAEPLVQAIANEVSATSVEPLGPALSTTPFSDGRSSLAAKRVPTGWMLATALAAALLVLALVAHRMGWLPDLSQSMSLKIDGRLSGSAREAEPDAAASTSAAAEAGDKAASKTVVSELPPALPQSKPPADPVAKTEPAPAKPVAPPATAKVEAQPAPAPVPAPAPPVAAAPILPKAEPAPAVAAAKAPDAADSAAKDMLVLKLRQDSWIDIRRSNNSPVVSRLARAGETETVKVSGPLNLTIGNAAGVEVLLRGKAVPLEPESNSNVAHLNLR